MLPQLRGVVMRIWSYITLYLRNGTT